MRTPAPLQYSMLDAARAFMMATHCAVIQKRKCAADFKYTFDQYPTD